MKKAIYYKGFTIMNYHEKSQQGYLIITPARLEVLVRSATSFEDCKWRIDNILAKWAIEQALRN